jgi:hypothetical protein
MRIRIRFRVQLVTLMRIRVRMRILIFCVADPDFYLMRMLIRMQIRLTKMMRIRIWMRIRIHNTGTNYSHCSAQGVLARRIQAKELRADEICAACLGLKKIKDFSLNSSILRASLYNLLGSSEPDPDMKVRRGCLHLLTCYLGSSIQSAT